MPIIVLSQNTKRESGHKVQLGNINAAKTIADVIRTCLGPRAMLKMLMDPMGGIVMTNDGNAILREIQVQHPAAKSMIEISRTQDEETGDGTTSVIILAGEVLSIAAPFLEQKMHPTLIIQSFRLALEDIINACKENFSVPVDIKNDAEVAKVVKSCLGTKMIHKWMDLAVRMAVDAVKTVCVDGVRKEIDLKRFARVEKIPGGTIEESKVIKGVVLNKDVTHSKMRRRIENPRIVILDCPLEYKKGESQTQLELTKEEDFSRILQLEEESIKKICDAIIRVKPDVVFTEKGVSDLAQHFLMKANITAIRRIKRTDSDRLSRICGASVVFEPEDIKPEDVGTDAGLFEIKKIGDEYFTFVTESKNPRACTVLLRGASKDILNEVDRNLNDAMNVVRNIMMEPKLCPGGGAIEMALAQFLTEKSKSIQGIRQWPYKAIARALEVIPRTLIQNCGGNSIRQLTALRAKHAQPGNQTWGIDGNTGNLVDMKELNIWDPLTVKLQVFKTAIETAILLLRIDDIVSGTKKKDDADKPAKPSAPVEQDTSSAPTME
uniref:T-complex protein 1 subunit gamma n=1 Tax=Romanomermis culicivorax TaxID=13658 RepID=A0A915K8T1_ROMCU